jgi:hypothetical protein
MQHPLFFIFLGTSLQKICTIFILLFKKGSWPRWVPPGGFIIKKDKSFDGVGAFENRI